MRDFLNKAGHPFRVLAPLAALLLSGCLLQPELYKKDTFTVDEWETWTGWNDDYGSHSASGRSLTYRLTGNQDDARDMPIDGLFPGLLLSRELPAGGAWLAEVSAAITAPPGAPKRFSFGVWLGEEYARPSLESPAARLKLLVQRLDDAPDGTARLEVSAPPLSRAPAPIPAQARAFRFRKDGSAFSVFYSLDGKSFTQALSVNSEAAEKAPSAKFVVGGRAQGEPGGARARFYGLRIK